LASQRLPAEAAVNQRVVSVNSLSDNCQQVIWTYSR
jgi:hypothetical protein